MTCSQNHVGDERRNIFRARAQQREALLDFWELLFSAINRLSDDLNVLKKFWKFEHT